MECYGSSIALCCETCPRSWSPWELGTMGYHGIPWVLKTAAETKRGFKDVRIEVFEAEVGKCPVLGICFTSLKQVFVGDYIPNSWVM